MHFSLSFFKILILAAIGLMAVGAVTLIVLWLKDLKTKEIW